MRLIAIDREAWSVGRSVCRSVCHTSQPCKNGWTDRDPVGLRTRVGPGNHVLDGGSDPQWEGQFWRWKGRPIVKYRETMRSSVQKRLNRSRCRLGCWLGWAKESRNRWVQIPVWEGAILGAKGAHCKVWDFLPWAVQKRLNRSICRLGYELGWADGSSSSVVFARWRQCALMGWHIGATWRIRWNRPCAAEMRPYVKLLWPLKRHRSTRYVNAACCYRPSSVACLSVCHTSEPCNNGSTDGDAVWVED